jgi:hypothetical protein
LEPGCLLRFYTPPFNYDTASKGRGIYLENNFLSLF